MSELTIDQAGDAPRHPAREEMTWISDVREAEELLRSPQVAAVLHARDSAPLLAGSVLTLDGPEHRDRRRVETRLMLREVLAHYEDTVVAPAIARRLARLAAAPRRPDGLVRDNLLDFVRMVLVELTATMIGLDGMDGDGELDALFACATAFGEAASVEWSLLDHDQIVAAGLEASDVFVDRWLRASLARRRDLVARWRDGLVAREALPSDLLTFLAVHAPELDDDGLRREAIFFLLASTSTTTHAAPHIIADILAWVDAHPEDRARLADLEFIQQAVNEGLRLHPPVPALLKRALQPLTLSTGREVAAGEYLAIDLDSINAEEAVFGPDAGSFDPHRPSTRSVHPYGWSFGDGPHVCLGRPLATSTTRSGSSGALGVLVHLVRDLAAAGLAVDPAAGPPPIRTDTVVPRFASFPVVFRAL